MFPEAKLEGILISGLRRFKSISTKNLEIAGSNDIGRYDAIWSAGLAGFVNIIILIVLTLVKFYCHFDKV